MKMVDIKLRLTPQQAAVLETAVLDARALQVSKLGHMRRELTKLHEAHVGHLVYISNEIAEQREKQK